MCSTNLKAVKKVRRPGLMQASNALGVTYQHLWRVVISGERKSPALLRRFRAFKKTGVATVASAGRGKYLNSPKAAQTKVAQPFTSQAAADNLSPAFFAVLNKLGLELVIVQIKAGHDSIIWARGSGINSKTFWQSKAIEQLGLD